MARLCKIVKERKREKLVKKYAKKRAELRAVIKSLDATYEEKLDAQKKIQNLPKNSNKTRLRSRCYVTGRAHGVLRKFGLSRHMLRRLAMFGFLPGIRKSSW